MDLELIPYGAASQNPIKPNELICEYGPDECYAMQAMACIMHARAWNSDKYYSTISCMMRTRNPAKYLHMCMQLYASDLRLGAINQCAEVIITQI